MGDLPPVCLVHERMTPGGRAGERSASLRVGAALVSLLGGVALLEVVLQLFSLVVWLRTGPGAGGAERPLALCVGDSYTFGVGASSPESSYPGQVESILKRRGGPSRVVNAGLPGRTSRELLLVLSGLLRQHRPRVVYILVGANDMWNHPALVTGAELIASRRSTSAASFAWRWRTLRLFRIARQHVSALLEPRVPTAALPFIGDWYAADVLISFLPDGQLRFGAKRASWKLEGNGVRVSGVSPEGDHLVTIAAGGLAVRGPNIPRGFVMTRERRTISGCEAAFSEEMEARLRHTFASADSLRLVRDLARGHPECIAIWQTLAYQEMQADHLEEEKHAYERVLSLIPAGFDSWRAAVLYEEARSIARRDPAGSIDALGAAFALDHDETKFFQSFGVPTALPFDEREVRRRLMAVPMPREALLKLEKLLDEHKETPIARTLAAHLNQIVAMCRAAKAEPVLLTYPFPQDALARPQRACAAASGAPLLDVEKRFERELKSRPREELFAPDGHCSDSGYAIIAEMVAEDVIARASLSHAAQSGR